MTTFKADIIAFIKANVRKVPFDNHNSCGKYQHLTSDAAQAHLHNQARSEHPTVRKRLEVYECRACGYFHIGHNPFKGRFKKFLKAAERGRNVVHPHVSVTRGRP